MSLSTPVPKFLLDENVRAELARFLLSRGFNVALAPKSAPDSKLASISKVQKRILVTNDWDFTEYTNDRLHALIWLKIPQHDAKALLAAFERLLPKLKKIQGKIIILKTDGEEITPLVSDFKT